MTQYKTSPIHDAIAIVILHSSGSPDCVPVPADDVADRSPGDRVSLAFWDSVNCQ